MRKVVLSREARDDVRHIWRSIVSDNDRAAERLVRKLFARMRNAAEFPGVGSPRPAFGQDARLLIEGRYLVLYRSSPGTLLVLRVVHGARDLTSL